MASDVREAADGTGARQYTFHAPQTLRVDPKYRTSAVFLRSFHAYSPARDEGWLGPTQYQPLATIMWLIEADGVCYAIAQCLLPTGH